MKILLTGCAGFIGSNLLDSLLANGHEVVGVDDLSTGLMSNIGHVHLIHPKFVFFNHDICAMHKFKIGWKPDVIIHLAALGSVPRSIKDPISTFTANVLGTQIVFDYAVQNKVRTVLYASSSSVYGESRQPVKTETMNINRPLSPYAASKGFAELLAHAYSESYRMNMVGLRFFNVFGPRQRADSEYAAVVPKFCSALLNGLPITIFDDGQQTRTFTPVRFVVDAIQDLLVINESPTWEALWLNITDERYTLSVETLAYAVADAMDIRPVIQYVAPRAGDIRDSRGSGQLLRALLNRPESHPIPSFRDELRKTCAWHTLRC